MDRRPLSVRNAVYSQRVGRWLANRGVSPNSISIFGMVFGVLAGLLFAATSLTESYHWALWVAGAICVQLRLLGNMFDGMVAYLRKRATALGELYNEVPDRISDAVTIIGFGFAVDSSPWLGLIAALLAVFTAYVRTMGKVAGAHQEFCGPMAKPQRMYLITLAALLMTFGASQWFVTEVGEEPTYSIAVITLWILIAGCAFTIVRRLNRIMAVLRSL